MLDITSDLGANDVLHCQELLGLRQVLEGQRLGVTVY